MIAFAHLSAFITFLSLFVSLGSNLDGVHSFRWMGRPQ